MKNFFLLGSLFLFDTLSPLSIKCKNGKDYHTLSNDLVDSSQLLSQYSDEEVYTTEEIDEFYFPAVEAVLTIVSVYEKSEKLPDDYVCLKYKLDSIFCSFNTPESLQEFLSILRFLKIHHIKVHHIEQEPIIIESQDEKLLVVPKKLLLLSPTIKSLVEDMGNQSSYTIPLTYSALQKFFNLLWESTWDVVSINDEDIASKFRYFFEVLFKRNLTYDELRDLLCTMQFLDMHENLWAITADYLKYRAQKEGLKNNDQLLKLLDYIESNFPLAIKKVEEKLIDIAKKEPASRQTTKAFLCGFSNDGNKLAVFREAGIEVYDIGVQEGQRIIKSCLPIGSTGSSRFAIDFSRGFSQISFSPDNSLVLVSPVEALDYLSNLRISRSIVLNSKDHNKFYHMKNDCAVFSPLCNEEIIKLNFDAGKLQDDQDRRHHGRKIFALNKNKILKNNREAKSIFFSSNGQYLVAVVNNSIMIYDARKYFRLKRLFIIPDDLTIKRAFISHNGESLGVVLANDDLEEKFKLRVYDVEARRQVAELYKAFNMYALAFVDSGKSLIFSLQGSKKIRELNVTTKKEKVFYELPVYDKVLTLQTSSQNDIAVLSAPYYTKFKKIHEKENLGLSAHKLFFLSHSPDSPSEMNVALEERKKAFEKKYPKVQKPRIQKSSFLSSSKELIKTWCPII